VRARFVVLFAIALLLLGTRTPGPPAAVKSGAFGRGSTIVLVHGLGSSREHWLPVARRLAARHLGVLADLPGHGESPMPQPFSLERARVALDRALDDAPGPVFLVGHSLGGLVAAAETFQRPDRIAGLVLVETALKPQVAPEDREALLEGLDRGYVDLLRGAYLAFGRDSAQGRALFEEVARMDPDVIKPWIRLAVAADLSRAGARCQVPVLAVFAERSWERDETWDDAARALGYDAIPNLRAIRLDGCGHFVMLDRPVELANAIERFLAAPDDDRVALNAAR